jgi:hypothetical protein
MRVDGYVHSVEGQDVTFLKMLDDDILELGLRFPRRIELPCCPGGCVPRFSIGQEGL